MSEEVFSFPDAKVDQAEENDVEYEYKSYQRTSVTSSATRPNTETTPTSAPAPAPAALIDLNIPSTGSSVTVGHSLIVAFP